ncbi:hypothetical protein Ccrd_004393, partial [Cynara cardunculus var. scolymus]
MKETREGEKHLSAWGNDAANEVITEVRQLLVENYFKTPSSALGISLGRREFLEGFLCGNNPTTFLRHSKNETCPKTGITNTRYSLVKDERQGREKKHLCAWGNDIANEVITETRQLLVENYFQTPSSALGIPLGRREFMEGFSCRNNPIIFLVYKLVLKRVLEYCGFIVSVNVLQRISVDIILHCKCWKRSSMRCRKGYGSR